MLHYYSSFNYSKENIRITSTYYTSKDYRARKLFVEDPFNLKKNLASTIPHTNVSLHITDHLMLILCRYFCVPQLKYGPLFYALQIHGSNFMEKYGHRIPSLPASNVDRALSRLKVHHILCLYHILWYYVLIISFFILLCKKKYITSVMYTLTLVRPVLIYSNLFFVKLLWISFVILFFLWNYAMAK